MSDPSYTATFAVTQSPHDVFAAVTNVRGWWSQDIEGPTDTLDREFTYRSGDAHRCTMKVVELVPDEQVTWRCLDNYFDFTDDKSEWIGTTITFAISTTGGETQLRFTHEGLVPQYECFDVCSNAWGGYITSSLRSLITTGTGMPNKAPNKSP